MWPPLSRSVKVVEKGTSKNLRKKRRPHFTYKRQSQVKEPFWYLQFGLFFYYWDFFYRLVRHNNCSV